VKPSHGRPLKPYTAACVCGYVTPEPITADPVPDCPRCMQGQMHVADPGAPHFEHALSGRGVG
jgi:hypothetical protein